MISITRYVDGVESIYAENPTYETGHDGSDGMCDCIGMCKGAIRRSGGNPSGLSGTNYAARYTIKNFYPIPSASALKVGEVVLKARKPGESGYSLPDKYKPGGSSYNGDLTDYYHIGTVTQVNPLVITHMTSPAAKKDTKLGKWSYYGKLPQVDYDDVSPTPSPTPERLPTLRIGDRGEYVTLAQTKLIQRGYDCGASGADGIYGQKTATAVRDFQRDHDLIDDGVIGAMTWVALNQQDDDCYTVTIDGLTKSQADALSRQYPNAIVGRG